MRRSHIFAFVILMSSIIYSCIYAYSVCRVSEIDVAEAEKDYAGIDAQIDRRVDGKYTVFLSGYAVKAEDDVHLVNYKVLLADRKGKFFQVKTFAESRQDHPNKPEQKGPIKFYYSGFKTKIIKQMLPDKNEVYEVYLLYMNDKKQILIPLGVNIRGDEM